MGSKVNTGVTNELPLSMGSNYDGPGEGLLVCCRVCLALDTPYNPYPSRASRFTLVPPLHFCNTLTIDIFLAKKQRTESSVDQHGSASVPEACKCQTCRMLHGLLLSEPFCCHSEAP